jgi:hypothetical protein
VVLLLQHFHGVGRKAVPLLPNAAEDEAGEKNRKRGLLNAA